MNETIMQIVTNAANSTLEMALSTPMNLNLMEQHNDNVERTIRGVCKCHGEPPEEYLRHYEIRMRDLYK